MDSQVQHDPESLSGSGKVVSLQEGRFIYCLTERREKVYPFTGLEGAKVETISYGKIAAVTSPIRTTSFDRSEKEAIKTSLLKHQEVINRIFTTCTVVPVRFGTIADDPVQVKELMQKIYLQVKAALRKLERKVELVVRASWDLRAVLQEVKSQILVENSGAADIQQKIAVGRQLFEAVDKRKKTVISTIHNRLYPVAVDFTVGRPDGPVCVPCTGREEMIFDCSYLVEREKETSFDEAVNRIGKEYEGTITFKCIGPLPPYSFARLEIIQGNFEVVDEARKTLGLPEKASVEEIKASYRKLSLAHHPDRNPDDPGAEERFRNVTRAYDILEAYCENNRWLKEGRTYSFAREDVESAVMVRGG